MRRARNYANGHVSDTTGNEIEVIAAVSGRKIFISAIVISNDSDTDSIVQIKNGGTVIMTIPAPGKSGATLALPVPIEPAVRGTNWSMQAGAALSTIYCTLIGYVSDT